MKRSFLFFLLFSFLFFSNLSFASYLPFFSLNELVNNSAYILQGTILDVNPNAYNKEIGFPFTIATLQVTNAIKGEMGGKKQIKIIMGGGLLPDGKYVTEVGAPVLIKGENVILFLDKHKLKIFEDAFKINTLSQGKFNVSEGNVYRSDDPYILLRNGTKKISISKEKPFSLSEFVDAIHDCIK